MAKKQAVQEPIDPVEFKKVAEAFANWSGGNRVEQFKYLAEALAPGWFEWHPWTMKIIEAGCKHRWIGLSGCSNCVAPETRIVNPITGEQPTIKYLTDEGIAPIVRTLHGPRQAEVPFVKGFEELFEVILSDGSRFTCTAKHRVLTRHGFRFVSQLNNGELICGYNAKRPTVVSIKSVGHGTFYDMTVPNAGHYFAEGAIHHNSCKTRNTAGFAGVWWLADPHNSAVIFCSTTMKMLKKRGWAEIQNFHQSTGGWGNMINSQTVWQCSQGDDKHSIFGKAVAEGNVDKSAADIQGLHVKRLMVVIDEAEATPVAIWKATANLYGYCEDNGGEFILFANANARSRLSQFGRFIEPEGGWNSVSVETDEWMSKPQMDGKKAKVIRFDFLKSPNIIEGKIVSKHLPTKQRVVNRMAALKARGGENDPDHFTYDRGYPVPEGLLKTVFTESLITKHDGYGKHKFLGTNFTIIGMFDQAFGGGDRPALRFGALGDIEGGKMGIEWMEAIILYIDALSHEPVRYQLKNKLKAACENVQYRGQTYQCLPENLAIDCTGDGGLADICQQEWSTKINRIIFSSSASETPVSNEDSRPGNEVFLNKRVEMYFRTRDALISGQIKGIDKDTAAELCNLEELVEKTDGSVRPKKTLQNKKDYKLKYQISPDLSDCAVGLTEVARLKGFFVAAVGLTVHRNNGMEEMVRKSQSIYSEETMYQSDNDLVEVDDTWL